MNCSRCHAGPTKNPQNGTASGGFFSRTNADPVTGFNLAGLETDVLGPLPNALQSFDNFLNDPTQIFLSFVSDEEEGHNMTDVGTRLTYEGDRNGINTPALANVWDNRPYMHDGRYRTLQEVLSNSWLSISEGYRAAPLAWGFIPDNAFNEPNGIPASEAALIAYNEPGTLYPFKTHEQYPAGSPPDPAVWARVTDYLTSIQGTNYPAGADPTADLTAFLDALSSQTILCGAEGDGAFLFSNVTVTPEAGQMRLSWNTVVPVPCEVTWGPVCNPNQTAPLTSRSTSHSVLLNAAQGMYKATIMAKMRTVCPDPARIEVTWGSESPIGTVTAPATTNLCPQGDMGNVVLQIDVQDGLYGSQISANRFSLCSQNDEGIVLYGSVHADGPANPPTLTTTMTITAGSGCDLSHPLTVLLDGTQVVGSVTTSLKSPDSAHPLGIVDMMDLEQFLPHYIAGGTYDACFDFNNNGTINVGDLGLLNAHMSHHTSGLMPTSQAAPGSARIACVEATRNAREIMVSLQAESKGKITSVLAVLDVPKGTKWEDDDSDRLAAWLDETQLVVVAWNPAGGGTIDLGSFQIPGGEIEAVQFIRGYVLEDGVSSSVAGMDYGSSPAGGIRLANLAPNPFRSSATLSFTLDAHEKVVVQAFDIGGRLVRTLQDGPLPAGAHDVVWDGRDSRGARLPAGIYFYRVSGEKSSITKKIVLLE